MKKLKKHLNSIIELLKLEKEVLIKDDKEKIEEIINKKNQYIEDLEEFKGIDMEKDDSVIKLIKEINQLQQTNLLLTEQALSYQNLILDSISKNIKSTSNTYSSKGNYESKSKASLIDESI